MTIFYLFQVVGNSDNLNTLVNFIWRSVNKNIRFNVLKNACKNIIDIRDLVVITSHFIDNLKINIRNTKYISTIDLVHTVENISGKMADYQLKTSGECIKYDLSKCNAVAKIKGIEFDDEYLEKALKKYYL
jgi:dTDP-4-dehydrorhamnose reductase